VSRTRTRQLDSLRALLRDAEAYAQVQEAYAKDRSLPRPRQDVVLASLVPAARRQMPVLFIADRAADIREAVAFAEEMKLQPIIVGGRDAWQVAAFLKQKDVPVLLSAVMEARGGAKPPIFLKLAPDLEGPETDDVAEVAISRGIDALIVSNTTISRPPLRSGHAAESGGLSGAPLKPLALAKLRAFRSSTGGEIPLIAAGGIESGADALARIRAGASLVQLYSALVFAGPGLARSMCRDLKQLLQRDGFANVAEAVGTEGMS